MSTLISTILLEFKIFDVKESCSVWKMIELSNRLRRSKKIYNFQL
jgi:hypothetical protein